MLPVLLFLLWFPSAWAIGSQRTYRQANLTLAITQFTSECRYSTTLSNITIHLGWLDGDKILGYVIRTPTFNGSLGREYLNFWDKMETFHRFNYSLSRDEFVQMEGFCAQHALENPPFRKTYEDCMQPNIIYYEMRADEMDRIMWAPSRTVIQMIYTFPGGKTAMNEVKFDYENNLTVKRDDNELLLCSANLVGAHGDYFMCRWNKPYPRDWQQGFKAADEFYAGEEYPCIE